MLAAQYAQTDRVPQAIALVEKAHNAQPANTRLTASLGELYIRAGQPAQALALARQGEGCDRQHRPAQSEGGGADQALDQKDRPATPMARS